jgi:hypothetical protein
VLPPHISSERGKFLHLELRNIRMLLRLTDTDITGSSVAIDGFDIENRCVYWLMMVYFNP